MFLSQKKGVVVIHKNDLNIRYLVPKRGKIENLWNLKNDPIFSNYSKDFISTFSKELISKKNIKNYPELLSLAFWMRKSNLKKIEDNFFLERKKRFFLSKGTVFHIAPANVDSIFIYSMMLSILMGNKNIVRISQRNNSKGLNLIIDLLNKLFSEDKWANLSKKNLIINYEYDDEINKKLSENADVRVICGGDDTVNRFRNYKLKPTASELCFPNKISISLINAKEICQLEDNKLKDLANKFCNDAYWFNQMACSSPRQIAWFGNNDDIKNAQIKFWNSISENLSIREQDFELSDSLNKSLAADRNVLEGKDIQVNNTDPRITRVMLYKQIKIPEIICGSGFFYEINLDKLKKIAPILNSNLQTISYFGFKIEVLKKLIYEIQPSGVNRIVPIGKALEFSYIWDGKDILTSFSREVTFDI